MYSISHWPHQLDGGHTRSKVWVPQDTLPEHAGLWSNLLVCCHVSWFTQWFIEMSTLFAFYFFKIVPWPPKSNRTSLTVQNVGSHISTKFMIPSARTLIAKYQIRWFLNHYPCMLTSNNNRKLYKVVIHTLVSITQGHKVLNSDSTAHWQCEIWWKCVNNRNND